MDAIKASSATREEIVRGLNEELADREHGPFTVQYSLSPSGEESKAGLGCARNDGIKVAAGVMRESYA